MKSLLLNLNAFTVNKKHITSIKEITNISYEIADAMLKRRKK